MLEVLPLPERLRLVPPSGPLPDDVEARIDAIWREAERQPGVLYNGPLVSVVEISSSELIARPAEYRHLVASRCDPAMRAALDINPLAVSGLVRVGDAVLLGRRADHLAYEAGIWELVPSGGIEPDDAVDGEIDARARLLAELAEEALIEPSSVASAEPFLLVRDERDDLHDLAFEVVVDDDAGALRDRFERASAEAGDSWEYSRLELVSLDRLSRWVGARELLPLSTLLLEDRRLLA